MEFLRKAYHWIDQYTNAALFCIALAVGTLMLLATCTSDAASGPSGGVPAFPIIVNPNTPGVEGMQGPEPGTLVFCEGTPGLDGIHICQIWLMVGNGMAVPASPEAYCFVAGEEEVIHNGTPQTRTNWSCGTARDELSEQRKAQGPVNFRKHLSRPGEISI